jgi:hypothetical protein
MNAERLPAHYERIVDAPDAIGGGLDITDRVPITAALGPHSLKIPIADRISILRARLRF